MTAAELRIAHVAFEYIETVARPYIRAGGRLWTKTPGLTGEQPATHLRKLLKPLDDTVPIRFTTTAAMTPGAITDREHALPVKRIAIEMIDPMQGDPRCGSNRVLIGRAESPEDVISIYRALAVVVLVTKAEHARLGKAHRSSAWDALGGDWRRRYAAAGIVVAPFQAVLTPSAAKPDIRSMAPS